MSSQIVALLSFSSIQTYHSRFSLCKQEALPIPDLFLFQRLRCRARIHRPQNWASHGKLFSVTGSLFWPSQDIIVMFGNVCVCRTLSSRTWWVLSDRRWRSSGTRFQSWRWIQMWLTTLIFIFHIQDTVNHLSRENEVLRANVAPEVLASLLGNRSILGGIPPDPSGHPALPPPNQH